MVLKDIKNVQILISEGYDEEGIFLNDLWVNISNSNPEMDVSQTFDALIIILRFMIENGIAELIRYNDQEKKLICWNGDGKDELKNLEIYLSRFNEKLINKNPNFLFNFTYMSYRWKIPYPMDLNKYEFA